ncbi:hypothetical protein McpSp1_11070 [Methanocorpusculaceae archaeon Sp1]|uniref:MarR family transcriptional regulator n=1 Tax=Methanorbis furvi TaxID=3028299 RepID=A0AAE4SAD7_9EURY|nr:hypothetical protein [Methanocorpusculaceae archaeon Sp1]MDV0442251.1 hypothetical protein [Methanocorpusculaceae archaeon Ag1]
MKDEEIDWALYHLLPESRPVTISALVEQCGLSREVVEASLERMENNCLIAVMGESVNLLSLSDMLMMNQMMHDSSMPVYIENGVIKAKK